ncbi:MAG TPA: hypothetical protein VM510_17900 [Caulifigura sp.]|jgi:hypothetical protein|nr:hypothetical protein [Caulifigura sp.]
MIAPKPRPPLINRPLVGILSIVGLVSGSVVTIQSFDNPWAGSLIRVGILLGMLWLFLAPSKEPVAKPAASPWFTIGLAAFGLLVIRNLKPGMIVVVIVFGVVAFLVRPRPRRG